MKKIIFLSIITASALNAFTSNTDLANKIQTLEQQIKELKATIKQNQNNNQNDQNKALKKEISDLKAKIKDNSEYVEEVDDSVSKLTANVLKNTRVGFTRLKFDTTMHNIHAKMADGSSKSNNNLDTINLKLDLEKAISPKLTFRGQLAMYKFWSQGNYYPYSSYDNMQGRVPSDSSLYVTRAYIDWKISNGNIPTVLTIGRQPSSSGPSWQYSNNGVRYGTYDALVFDGNADGIVATMGLDKVTSLKNSALRFAYGKGFQNNSISSDLKDTDVYGLFFESNIPSIKNSFMQIYTAEAKNITTPGDSNHAGMVNTGNIDWLGFMFEFNNINHFDFFGHYSISKAKPNGKIGNVDDTHKAGLLTNTAGDTDTKTGNAIWLGTRYSFTSKAKIGLEYGHGSKNWINMTQGSDNILNPRSVRGDVWDIYGIYPIDHTIGVNAFIKIGATLINYDYTGSSMPFGAPQKITNTMPNANQTLDKVNDYYINFQVNY